MRMTIDRHTQCHRMSKCTPHCVLPYTLVLADLFLTYNVLAHHLRHLDGKFSRCLGLQPHVGSGTDIVQHFGTFFSLFSVHSPFAEPWSLGSGAIHGPILSLLTSGGRYCPCGIHGNTDRLLLADLKHILLLTAGAHYPDVACWALYPSLMPPNFLVMVSHWLLSMPNHGSSKHILMVGTVGRPWWKLSKHHSHTQ